MKKIVNKKKFSLTVATLFAVAVAVSVLFYACKKPTDGINILVASQPLSPAATLVVFQNADTTSVNQPGDFNVTISGSGASSVQMVSGGTAFKAMHGLLPLSLVKGSNPTVDNPVEFTITAQVPGFAPFIQNVSITSTDPGLYVVKAYDYLTVSPGSTLTTGAKPLSAGALTSPLLITTPTNANMAENATISFASGTQMRDANGNVINSSNLAYNVVQLGVENDAVSDGFPGGLEALNALDINGQPIADGVNFVPAALLSINMTADGSTVKSFSKPVNVTVELNSGLTNLVTDLPLAVGDAIGIWSQNDLTGQWKYEGDATVFLDGNNKLAVTMPITHLSNYAVTFVYSKLPGTRTSRTRCSGTLKVVVKSPKALGSVTATLYSASTNVYKANKVTSKKMVKGRFDGSYYVYNCTFKKIPDLTSAKIRVKGTGMSVTGGTFSTCNVGTVTIIAPKPTAVDPVDIAVNVQGICTNKQVSVLPTAAFAVYKLASPTAALTTGTFVETVSVENGIGKLSLIPGTTYNFGTTYNGTYYQSGAFTVGRAPFPIPTVKDLNLTSAYDATADLITVNGTFPVPCN